MKTKYLLLFSLFVAVSTFAQEKLAQKAAPKTQLEAFEAETGAVIIKGYTEIGKVTGMGSVSVDCKEFTNAKTGKKKYGITIGVTEAGRLEREGRSQIDYEEIDALILGIDYISRVTASVTKLKNFEATYTTNGDFTVTVFNNSTGKLEVAVTSGSIGRASAYFGMEKLPELRALILKARDQLQSIQR